MFEELDKNKDRKITVFRKSQRRNLKIKHGYKPISTEGHGLNLGRRTDLAVQLPKEGGKKEEVSDHKLNGRQLIQ